MVGRLECRSTKRKAWILPWDIWPPWVPSLALISDQLLVSVNMSNSFRLTIDQFAGN
jgi:hypothetical protein